MSFAPFTTQELLAIGEVLQHQRDFSPLPPNTPVTAVASELHIALDGSGTKEISRQVQPAHGGEMDEAMAAAASSAAGCRIFHNHPNQGSLSASDWNVLANHPAMEMVAVNSRGTTFRGRVLMPGAFPDWFASVHAVYGTVSAQWEAAITDWANQGSFELVDFANDNGWLVGAAIGEHLQSKAFAEFEFDPAGTNVEAMSHPCFPQIWRLLHSWCVAATP